MIREKGLPHLAKPFASVGLAVLCLVLAANSARAAGQTLDLEPNQGAAGSFFTATYEVPPGAAACPSGTVEFWWKTAGTSGGAELGSDEMQSCKATGMRLKVPESTCDRHNVYAFRRSPRTGEPDPDTSATAVFTVEGCAPASPTSPPPGGTTPTPGKTSPSPGTTTSPPFAATSPTETTSATPDQSPEPSPTSTAQGGAAAPLPPPPGGGPGIGGFIPYIVLAAVPLGAWVLGSVLKLGPFASGGIIKWGALGLALGVGVGFSGFGYFKAVKGTPNTIQFDYKVPGLVQFWKVPDGVKKATFSVLGAQGGTGCNSTSENHPLAKGGLGGQALATVPVTPGETLRIFVGVRGGSVALCGNLPNSGGGSGGFNGGGEGGTSESILPFHGGGGGGASDVRRAPYGLANRILVAGGGGGGGTNDNTYSPCGVGQPGGSGGGNGGLGAPEDLTAQGGEGGQDDQGGLWGGDADPVNKFGIEGGDGSWGAGGDGGDVEFQHGPGVLAGAGGGGGWYGGGGGGSGRYCGGGGGGGSGHGPPGALLKIGIKSGHGQVVIQYTQYSTLF